jgi:ribosomal protein L37AE/L43A
MPKGSTCPFCGAQAWHAGPRGGRKCSNCGARGWYGGETPAGGGGRGLNCPKCDKLTFQRIDDEIPELRFCSRCGTVGLRPAE